MQSSKEIFRAFCEKEKNIPLFLTFDWLNTVASEKWDVAIEAEEGEIIGILPYILNTKKGFKFIELAPFTPVGGVWIKYPNKLKHTSILSYEKKIYSNLINKLPLFDSFVQKFHPSITNWLPFYWYGFKQSTGYTYVLNDITDKKQIFENFKDDVRRNIRRSEKTIQVLPAHNIEVLYNLKVKSYQRNGMKIIFNLKMLQKIYDLCIEKNTGELLIAKEGDIIYGATLFVWDNTTCYNLIAASDPEHKNTDAMSLIIWHAIQRNSGKVKEFNFEGSMIQGIESFFRSFGAKQVPYFILQKTNSRILKIKNFLSDII